MAHILAVDVGGTKTAFAVYRTSGDDPVFAARYVNDDFDGPQELFTAFRDEYDDSIAISCIAAAGVIGGGEVTLTNRPWHLAAATLGRKFRLGRVLLVNDLSALAASIPTLGADDLITIQQGNQDADAMRAVLAPGTGLGQGMFFADGKEWRARGSEGGHTDFGPINREQRALLEWMVDRFGEPVNYEMLISGPGLPRLFDFCRDYHRLSPLDRVAQAMAGAEEPAAVITGGVRGEQPCPLCVRTMQLFTAILGAEAGNLALKLYALGGVYLGGGILPRVVDEIDYGHFLTAFVAKGKMAELMRTIPVQIIMPDDAPLRGARELARREYEKKG